MPRTNTRLAAAPGLGVSGNTVSAIDTGTRTIVDVLITQQSLFQAQREYARARHDFLVNTLRLKQAAGTIALADLQEVNRVLVQDAEAALDESLSQ